MNQMYVSLTQEAIDRAEANADALWKTKASEIVNDLAKNQRIFTTDHVWAELDKTGISTHEPRALGPVILRAIKDGIIVGTGAYRKSLRTACHRRPVPIYVSRLT